MNNAQAKVLAVAAAVVIVLAASHLASWQITQLNDEVDRAKRAVREMEIKVNEVKKGRR